MPSHTASAINFSSSIEIFISPSSLRYLSIMKESEIENIHEINKKDAEQIKVKSFNLNQEDLTDLFLVQGALRSSLNSLKRETIVWENLKKYFAENKFEYEIFEKERYIDAQFNFADGIVGFFRYKICDGGFICTTKIIDNFPLEFATDFFVLATYFNNFITNSRVIINTDNPHVAHYQNSDIIIPLLYAEAIHGIIGTHYDISKDIFWAFKRLVNEKEAPAIIFADLWKKIEKQMT